MIINNCDTILIGNNVDSSNDDNKLCILKSILYQESVAIFCTNTSQKLCTLKDYVQNFVRKLCTKTFMLKIYVRNFRTKTSYEKFVRKLRTKSSYENFVR